jgi:hypothetical protein
MNLTEAVNKLGVLMANFNKENAVATEEIVSTEQTFKDEKLVDGMTIISYDAEELAVGVVVYLLDEAGQKLPLPVGDYTTESGSTFTVVDETGAIDNVVVKEAEEVEEGDAPAPATEVPMSDKPAMGTPKRVIKSQVEEHVFSIELEDYEVIKVDLSSMFTAKDKEIADLKELNAQMFEVVKQLSELPASTPTESKEKFNVSKEKMSFKQSMRELEEQMSKQNLES